MGIENIINGENGLSVRAKLNQLVNGVNNSVTGGTVSGTDLLLNRNDGGTFTVDTSSYFDSKWTQSGSSIYNLTNNVGIGTSDPLFNLDIVSSGGTSSFEDIARFRTIDSTDYLAITNAVSTDGSFNPVIRSFNNTNTSTNLYIQSVIDPSVDTGTNPLIMLQGRVNTEPGVDPWSGVTTRPIVRVRNNSTNLLDVTADGKVGINTITPTEKLDVNGNAIIRGGLSADTISATTFYGDGSNLIGIYWSGSTGTNSLTPINSGSVASGLKSMAIGNQTTASGDYSYSEGYQTTASGERSHAEGSSTTASGDVSHAEGAGTTASGILSHAEGEGTTASGQSSHAEGEITTASGNFSHAEGTSNTASGLASHAEGQSTIASGTTSHAEGYLTKAFGDYSHAEGHSNTASGIASHVEGGYWGKGSNPNVASGDGSHAEGGGTTASGDSSHAEGENTTASNNSSHAEGGNTTASGIFSHAEGEGTTSSGPSSHAEGGGTIASGIFSHAEGEETTASGDYSHSEGTSNTASGIASHVEGGYLGKGVLPNVASGNGSHAEGGGTTASGVGSHAEGENTTASNNNSHAEGDNTLASGGNSHAEGFQTTASGDSSHAEGGGTIASGLRSHTEGLQTTASGENSHAGGNGSTASGNTSFIHSTNSLVTGDRSVILGGQNITGTTNDTVYVPYLRVIDSVNIGTPNPSVDAGPPINIINNDALYSINAGSGNTLGGNYSMTLGNNLRAIGDGLLVGGTSTNTPIIYGGNSSNYSISWGRNVEMYSDATDSLCNIAVGDYINFGGGSGNAVFGSNNTIRNNESCVITGSENRMENSNGLNPSISSSIIGGTGNTITKTSRGAIIGGDSNEISLLGGSPEDSVIIGGSGNTISHNRSVILGGKNISSTANDTVYVPNLNIQTTFTPSSSGDTTGSIGSITWDNNYLYVKTNNGWGRSSLDYGF